VEEKQEVIPPEVEEQPTKEEQPAEQNPPEQSDPPQEVKEPAEGTDPLSTIAGALAEGKPEKQDHFVEKTRQKREAKNAQAEVDDHGGDWRFLKDKSGRYWSAEICSAKIDPVTSIPRKTKTGLWELQRGKTKADRNKLPKRPPNIEAKMENAAAEADAQAAAVAEQQEIEARAAMYVKGFLSLHRAALSQYSCEEAVTQVMDYSFGEGKHKITVSQVLEMFGTKMMIKRGGGPEPSPELVFLGGLGVSTAAVIFHPTQEKRRETAKEKLGLWWYRLRNRGKKPQKKPEQQQQQQGGRA